jgi:hypothetical protein
MLDRLRPIAGWMSLALGFAALPLACRNAERHAEAEYSRDLAQHKYRTGLTLAEVVNGGIHDLWTDTHCETRTGGGGVRSLHSWSHTSCYTTRLGFKDGAGNDFVFHVAVHSPTRPYYLVPLTQGAREALEKVTGKAWTPSALSEFLGYDLWLADVVPRWKSLAPSITDSRSSRDSSVEATVRLAGEGGRPLAFVHSRFTADPAVKAYVPVSLARGNYELRELQFVFPDEDFFARHGAEIIAGALAPHAREMDWKREAANVVAQRFEMIERCSHLRLKRCTAQVEMVTIESWPDLELEQSSGELRLTVLDRVVAGWESNLDWRSRSRP